MNGAAKLAAFAAALAATFGGAVAVGAAVGPIDVAGTSGRAHGEHVEGGSSADATASPRGVSVTASGLTFVPDADEPLHAWPAATPATFAFRILDAEGSTVTAFDVLHERRLHLVVVSRNLVDYLHLHPTMDSSGRWSVDLPGLAPGSYRVYADFQPAGGANLTLATDITIAGSASLGSLPEPATTAVVDGYTVTLDGVAAVGEVPLSFTVRRDGAEVRTDPYLGAAGHLVAIRAADLAYLHVHPEDTPSATVTFVGELPTAGTYRLFFDFSHGGRVHTASFTLEVPDTPHAGAHPEGEH